MKKKYEKPFIMKLDISNTNMVAESTPIPTETWECTFHEKFSIDDAYERWSKVNKRPCNDNFLGYSHY